MIRKFVCSILIGLSLAIALNLADGPAHADPEIGQAISAFKMPITELDGSGSDSVFRNCRKGETKYIMFDAGFKPGVKGRFAQISSSLARLKLSDGNVLKVNGLAVDASRRLLAFTVPALESGRKVSVDPTGNNTLTLTVKGGAGPRGISLTPVESLCVTMLPPTSA